MKKFFLILAGGVFSFFLNAQESLDVEEEKKGVTTQQSPVSVWPSSELREIRVVGMMGSLAVTSHQTPNVRVTFDEGKESGAYLIQNTLENGVLTITAKTKDRVQDAKALVPARVQLKISAPSMPLDIHFAEGELSVKNWSSNANLHLLRGKINVSKSKGRFRLFYRRGQAQISDHEGVVELDTVFGTATISGGKGDLTLANFSGSSTVEKFEGAMRLTSHNGTHHLAKNKGAFNYDLAQSELNLSDHDGKIIGEGKESVVRLGYVGKANIRVRSGAGNVFVKSPKASGARINIGSTEGFLGVPSYIKATQWASIKVARGRLDGFRPGSIYVRTQSGAVYLR